VVLVARDQQKGMVVAIRVHAARGDLSTIVNGVGVNAASDGTFKKITSSMRIPANRKTIAAISTKVTKDRTPAGYYSFSYSSWVTIRMGMSGSENCGLAAPEHVDTASMDSTAATQTIVPNTSRTVLGFACLPHHGGCEECQSA
jgi:hypothetical protein